MDKELLNGISPLILFALTGIVYTVSAFSSALRKISIYLYDWLYQLMSSPPRIIVMETHSPSIKYHWIQRVGCQSQHWLATLCDLEVLVLHNGADTWSDSLNLIQVKPLDLALKNNKFSTNIISNIHLWDKKYLMDFNKNCFKKSRFLSLN